MKALTFARDVIKKPDNSQAGYCLGASGEKAVPNDEDGDGKGGSAAVWRDSTGMWYIRQSHDNSSRQVQWGTSGDIPVPSFYRR